MVTHHEASDKVHKNTSIALIFKITMYKSASLPRKNKLNGTRKKK